MTRQSMGIFSMCTVLAATTLFGCRQFSEQIEDQSVGMNGGFEHTESGLPVNWLVYTPATIPTGDYELLFDRTDFKEGAQSLKFLVHECSSTGGWHSPGITQQYPVTPGASYLISFWIKSEDSDWVVAYAGVAPKTGAPYEIVDSSNATGDSWHRVERQYTIPQEYKEIRFELTIRSPGTVWIDDVRIDPLVEDGG